MLSTMWARRAGRIIGWLLVVVVVALAAPLRAAAAPVIPRTQEEAWAVLADIAADLAGVRREALTARNYGEWWQQNGHGIVRAAIWEAVDGRLKEILVATQQHLTAREIWSDNPGGAAYRYMAQIRQIRSAAEQASAIAAEARAADKADEGWRGKIAELAEGASAVWEPIRDTSTWMQETARRIQDLSYPQQRSAAETLSRIWGVWSQGCGSVGSIPDAATWLGMVPDGTGQTCDMVRSLRGIGATLQTIATRPSAEWRPDTEEHCGAICRVARDVGQWRDQREESRWEKSQASRGGIAERLSEIARHLKQQGQGGGQQPKPDPQGPDWQGNGAGSGLSGWGGVGSCMALPAPQGDCGDGPAITAVWAGETHVWYPLRGICAGRAQIEPWMHVAGALWVVGCTLLAARWLAASYGIATPGRGADL